MQTHSVPATPVNNRYRRLMHPTHVGELRVKSWRYLFGIGAPTSPDDIVWQKRCKDYWDLQGKTYGLKFEQNVVMVVSWRDCVVTTFAIVKEILPGARVD